MRTMDIARRFIFQTLVAVVGTTAIWLVMMAVLGRSGENLLDFLPLVVSPLGWGPGFILGFFVNRGMRDRIACWGWPLSTAWLVYGIWDECRDYRFPPWNPAKGDFVHRGWHMFFTSFKDAGAWGGSPLAILVFTIPALGSVAYSLGAWVALHSKPSHA
jgi:hypothetical protein